MRCPWEQSRTQRRIRRQPFSTSSPIGSDAADHRRGWTCYSQQKYRQTSDVFGGKWQPLRASVPQSLEEWRTFAPGCTIGGWARPSLYPFCGGAPGESPPHAPPTGATQTPLIEQHNVLYVALYPTFCYSLPAQGCPWDSKKCAMVRNSSVAPLPSGWRGYR